MDLASQLKVLQLARHDPASLALATVDLTYPHLDESERVSIQMALQAAAIPHWCDDRVLSSLLGLSLRESAIRLALLRSLHVVEPFPARGQDALNVHEAARLAIRKSMAKSAKDRFQLLSARAAAHFSDDFSPAGRIEWIFHVLCADFDQGTAKLEQLDRDWDSMRPDDRFALSGALDELAAHLPTLDVKCAGTLLSIAEQQRSRGLSSRLEGIARQAHDSAMTATRPSSIVTLPTKVPDDRSGLQRISACDDPSRSIDIVFIHGLDGDSWTSWMSDEKDIDTFWPIWLARKFSNAGIWSLGYAASSSKWRAESMPLADRGIQLLDLLANDGIGERPLALITHSMGGILAKQLLHFATNCGDATYEGIARQVRGVAFISTPHSGASIAGFAELVSLIYRTNEHVAELGAHEARLRELHGYFQSYHSRQRFVCKTYCERREVQPEILGFRLPKGILVVDPTSAEPNIPGVRAIPLDEDHISICKPRSQKAQLYKGIVRFIRDCTGA